MLNISKLPKRQKIFVGLSTVIGLLLYLCIHYTLVKQETINTLIFIYSIGIPIVMLYSNLIIDLNSSNVFSIWLVLAITIYVISLLTYNTDIFLIQRKSTFNKHSLLNSWLSNYSTSALRSLFLFLLVYWLVNMLFNKRGLYVINTFNQYNWYHDTANRNIKVFDIIVNAILFLVIVASGLFGK